jgi:hypothetical protein
VFEFTEKNYFEAFCQFCWFLNEDMELFFKKTLSDISSRSKRIGHKSERVAQKSKISNIEKSSEENNFSKISNFLNLMCDVLMKELLYKRSVLYYLLILKLI